jgi:molybdopterin molybdotransferase
VGPEGQLILGLPGNPLSVAVTFRRYGVELLRYVAGMVNPELFSMIEVESDDPKTLDLTWFRLVKKQSNGKLSLVSSKGSGDIASLLQSDGFIEVPRHTPTTGMRRFFPWNR